MKKTHHQGEKVKAMTVVCSCGVSFCFTCKQIGGHEPVPWQGGKGEKGIKTVPSGWLVDEWWMAFDEINEVGKG